MEKKKLKERKTILQKFLDNGINNTERRIVSVSAINKTDDGTYVFVGKSRLHGSVRNTKTKTDNVHRQFKSTCHE